MRQCQYTVTPQDVGRHAAHLCQESLLLESHGPKCRAGVLLQILFYAAARVTSIAAACRELDHAPSDQAVYDALAATLPESPELHRRLNRALAGDLPKALTRRTQPLAIDFTPIADHGKRHADEAEIYRGQPKHGTSHFHAYATAYVLRNDRRFTVALRPV